MVSGVQAWLTLVLKATFSFLLERTLHLRKAQETALRRPIGDWMLLSGCMMKTTFWLKTRFDRLTAKIQPIGYGLEGVFACLRRLVSLRARLKMRSSTAAGGVSRPRYFAGFGKGLSIMQQKIPNLFPHQLD
ncbi:hypothetical protein WJX75_009480 [Coccomyxa subellipsoidea]|uniref:Transposase DDE domain-containing protein n=1 Tax=Coccomyxa subellipsoidea TaxID=248742 RepID=A0ABR2YQC1_9CHLO